MEYAEDLQMDSQESAKRMEEGRLYLPSDPEIMKKQFDCLEKLYDYNQTRPHDQELRARMLKDMFAELGEGCYIEPPLRSNWGGYHTHFGDHVYANFNLTLVDDGHIYVGSKTMIGPNVTIATAGHPVEPNLRYLEMQYNMDVHIGRCMDRRRMCHPSGCDHRGQYSYRSRQHCHKGHPGRSSSCRKSMPGTA